jgi:hypothetical protein
VPEDRFKAQLVILAVMATTIHLFKKLIGENKEK